MRFALALMLIASGAAAADEPQAAQQWRERHPAASVALGDWVRTDRESARHVFHWAREHPLRAQAFLKWMVDHPQLTLDDFLVSHADWPVVELLMKPRRAAFDGLVRWEAQYPAAANDLAAKPRGLAAAGFHLYRSLWDTEATP